LTPAVAVDREVEPNLGPIADYHGYDLVDDIDVVVPRYGGPVPRELDQ
jgi:hypothetical protein